MTPPVEELAALYVLDQLEPAERANFEARLEREPELRSLVRSLELTLEQHIRALPQHTPPAALLSRIESQLHANVGQGLPTPPSAPPSTPTNILPFWPAFTRWILPAAAAIILGAATFFYLDHQRAPQPVILVVGLDPQHNTVTEIPLQTPARDTDARFIQLASLAEQFWTEPNQLPPASDAARNLPAYALFDPATRQGFIAVQQLPQQPADKRYHLWLVDTETGRALDAGSLPSATSRGLYFFSLDPSIAPASGPIHFLITAEDKTATSPARPRGTPILGQNPI